MQKSYENNETDGSTSQSDSDDDEFFEPLDPDQQADLHYQDLEQFDQHKKDFELYEAKTSRKMQAKNLGKFLKDI